MVTLTIDGRAAVVEEGTTILAAARGLGIHVPTLCHVEPFPPSASCFLCAVRIEGRATLSPSCAMPVANGMVVHTNIDEVRASRKMALELLLSDHTGDCIGPCRTGCPARLDIPGFIAEISGDHLRHAAEIVCDDLVLPGALGRICPRLCEDRCRRADSETSLSVGGLHRFVADRDAAAEDAYVPRKEPPTGKTVAIVGAGPAGLAAAYMLLRRGHTVTLFDAHPEPGGMLRYGVPAFRLPRRVLDREIDTIRSLGGQFRMSTRLSRDVTLGDLRREYGAVFLAIGAQGSRRLDCPGDELATPALELLADVASGRPPRLGGPVVIVGGGNSAMDAARTAVRLGADSVTLLYRRTRREMPSLMSEVAAAEAEGVRFATLAAPVRLEKTDDGLLRVTCRRMELGAPDESGRARPVAVPGSEFVLDASCVVAAVGLTVEADGADGLARSPRGLAADPVTLATNLDGVFAGGDAVTGADVAVRAVAAGKLAAASIDQYLGGRPVRGHPELVNVLMGKLSDEELAQLFREIEQSPRAPMPELRSDERIRTFEEVELGLPLDEVLKESTRCLRCGCSLEATCRLRRLATEYGADPLRFAGERRHFQRDSSHPEIVYEPGKCILCGVCVKAAAEAGDGLGLAIVGRGFESGVGVPFKGSLAEALPTAGRRVAEACPTGAFALKGDRSCAFGAAPPAWPAGAISMTRVDQPR